MVYIRAQNIKRDSSGRITGGTASVVRSERVSTDSGSSSRQKVVERLGKVLFLSENGRSGIFRSPTRGLVSYSADTGAFGHVSEDDPRIAGAARPDRPFQPQENAVHKVFGDAYLLLGFLKECGMLQVLRETFRDDSDYERMLCHLLFNILRDGETSGAMTSPQSPLPHLCSLTSILRLSAKTTGFTPSLAIPGSGLIFSWHSPE